MSRLFPIVSAILFAGAATPAMAQDAPPAPPELPTPPKLIVAISVDQLSADLFAQYRAHFTGGFARLAKGAVFPSGYQAHSATETCPGHASILTGAWPSRTGIIGNNWTNLDAPRADKTVYCVEDESVPGSSSDNYTVSTRHLKAPTLGDRMKAVTPATRVVAVSQKDRAAVTMGGKRADETWWLDGKAFTTYPGNPMPDTVVRTNAAVARRLATAQPAMPLPAHCAPIPVGAGKAVGTGRFARAAGDVGAFRTSPESDAATLALAAAFVQDMKLGQGSATDVLAVSASATDYVGHSFGAKGTEMCLQLTSLDRDLGSFLDVLDATGVDYAVVLTADHGSHNLPKRNLEGQSPVLAPFAVGKTIAADLGLANPPLHGGAGGDIWIDPALSAGQRDAIATAAIAYYRAHPQVAAVLTRSEIAATPRPTTSPERWSIAERARATFDPERSGDLVVVLKPRATLTVDASRELVGTHGSFWDYDRRVPILFWREGMAGFEQPLPVQVVDILPSLAGWIGLDVPADEIDGQCLDLIAGPGTSCS